MAATRWLVIAGTAGAEPKNKVLQEGQMSVYSAEDEAYLLEGGGVESGLSADAFVMGKRDAGASAGFVRYCGNLSWRWQLNRPSALEKVR